jgi:site-specific recombinase XerC
VLQCPVGEAEDVAGLADRRKAMSIETLPALRPTRVPWNKGRIIGQKRPLLPKLVWSIRVRLEMTDNKRDLALFNMAVDSKLRGCDLVCLKVNDVYAAGRVKERASVTQSKTRKPVRFEITETTRLSVERWIKYPEMIGCEYLWPSRVHASPHLSTRQYARIMRDWILMIGLEPSAYGTHSMRRTKFAQIYKKTGNLRAVQLLLGHTKMDSTVRYLGVDLDDALILSESIDL